MVLLFWLCLAFVVYTYFGYPWLLSLRARAHVPKLLPENVPLPAVTVVIPAYNEQAHIATKLRSVFESYYPPDRLQIVVLVDGAGDGTAAAARSVQDSRLHVIEKLARGGKAAALNDAMQWVETPITVLTDAAEVFDRSTLRQLVRRFADPEVGAVSGDLDMIDEDTGFSRNLGLYWRYEKAMRRHEARLGSVVGATGPIYAIRTALYKPLPTDTVLDDVAIPFEIVQQGYRVTYAEDARATERSTPDGRQEFVRKRRTLAGNFQIIFRYWRLLIPGHSPIAWQFWSHKVFRLLVPYALAGLLAGSFALRAPWSDGFVSLQLLFYVLAAWVYFWPAPGRRPWLILPYTFCLLNWAALSGSVYYFSGRLSVRWEKVK